MGRDALDKEFKELMEEAVFLIETLERDLEPDEKRWLVKIKKMLDKNS